MDAKNLQPSIDALNAEIVRLTSARDTLTDLGGTVPKSTEGARAVRRQSSRNRDANAARKRASRAKKKGTK